MPLAKLRIGSERGPALSGHERLGERSKHGEQRAATQKRGFPALA
jgi:hypothetical protein